MHEQRPVQATPDPDPAEGSDAARRAPVRSHGRAIARAAIRSTLALALLLAAGNLVITVAWQWQSRSTTGTTHPLAIADVHNLRAVDAHVWRGSAPSDASYRDLADAGATTVVDLRAEDDVDVDADRLADLGLELVRIPMRDGQAPTPAQVDRFLAAVGASDGPVFVHCGAGVGRTGTMVAAYLVAAGRTDGLEAMRRNLAVGPPSLEQLAFAASLGTGAASPNLGVVAASRFLDAPRRAWTVLRG